MRFVLIFVLLASCGSKDRVEKELEDGTTIAYNVQNELKEGLFQSFYKNGQLKSEVYFEKGLREGKATYFDSLGIIYSKELYKFDTLVHYTDYWQNGNIKEDVDMLGKRRNGAYFYLNQIGDTLIAAHFSKGKGMYIKSFDTPDQSLKTYQSTYKTNFRDHSNMDSLIVELQIPSPDPNVKWKFALGDYSNEEIENYTYEKSFVDLKMDAVNVGSLVLKRSTFIDGRLRGIIVEYDKDYVFHTPVDEKIE